MPEARILLLEDDQTLRDVIAEALREDGYVVEVAGDGRAGLDLATRRHPDLVILDLMMPHMNGEEFSTALRRIGPLKSVPIIIVSASRYAPEVGTRLGAHAALRKPFDLNQLTDCVNQLLR